MIETVVISFTSFLIFITPFVFMGLMRLIRYRETIELADRGLVDPRVDQVRRANVPKRGIMLTCIGLALSAGLYTIGFDPVNAGYPLNLGPWMLGGFIPTSVGIALIIIGRMSRGEQEALPYYEEAFETQEFDEIPESGPYGVGIESVMPAARRELERHDLS